MDHPMLGLQDGLLVLAFVAGAIKLVSTFYLVRNGARSVEFVASPFGKRVYLASKVSPLLMALSLFLRATFAGNVHASFWTGALVLGTAALVLVVVHLRRKGLWYGAAHSIMRKREPSD